MHVTCSEQCWSMSEVSLSTVISQLLSLLLKVWSSLSLLVFFLIIPMTQYDDFLLKSLLPVHCRKKNGPGLMKLDAFHDYGIGGIKCNPPDSYIKIFFKPSSV